MLRCLPEEEALKIFKNILQGLKDLICVGIIHRDIKPANILINDGAFKLTDFGFAREVTNHQDTIMNSLVGTPLYFIVVIVGT
jgi:serine/threonine-protein kinase ULK/ATG1